MTLLLISKTGRQPLFMVTIDIYNILSQGTQSVLLIDCDSCSLYAKTVTVATWSHYSS